MRPNSLSPAQARLLRRLRDALEPVAVEGLSLEVLTGLLTIALEPGVSVNELADRLHTPQQTASRYAAILLGRYQEPTVASGQPPKWPLVVQEVHAEDPRRRAMFLTERGKEFVDVLLSHLSGADVL
jgi:DNA-binding MarR family transcriptional regulator